VSWRDSDRRRGYRSTSTPTPARCRSWKTAARHGLADTLIRTAPDKRGSRPGVRRLHRCVRLLVGPLPPCSPTGIAVLARTLRDRVGASPTQLRAMVNSAVPARFEKHNATPPPWGEVERQFGWTESVATDSAP
jgi:hypothetical protein